MAMTFLKIGTAAVALTLSSTCFATALVVRAVGPSAKLYPRGKALPDQARIKLERGDSVMLLNTGGTRTLRGPGTFALAEIASNPSRSAARRGRTGALRSGGIALNPSAWNLDITQSGKLCVLNPAQLSLWRPDSETPIKLTIRGNGAEQTVDWPAGKDTIAWPTSLPISTGAEYQLSHAETGDTARVTFVTVSNPPKDQVGTAQTLIANGCENQLDVLIETSPALD